MYGDYIFNYEPFYVGKGKNLQWKSHLKNVLKESINYESNKHKYYKIRKILKVDLEPIILKIEDGLFEQAAFDLEIWLIWAIGRNDLKLGPLTNLTDGGDGVIGLIISEETKKKMSIIRKNSKKCYDATKKMIRERSSNNEWKNKLRENRIGTKSSLETKIKIGKNSKGNSYRSKTYIIEKDSEIIKIKNLAKFCRNNNLSIHSMYSISYSEKIYKGYKIRKEIQK
jgi:hypothetical protein